MGDVFLTILALALAIPFIGFIIFLVLWGVYGFLIVAIGEQRAGHVVDVIQRRIYARVRKLLAEPEDA